MRGLEEWRQSTIASKSATGSNADIPQNEIPENEIHQKEIHQKEIPKENIPAEVNISSESGPKISVADIEHFVTSMSEHDIFRLITLKVFEESELKNCSRNGKRSIKNMEAPHKPRKVKNL